MSEAAQQLPDFSGLTFEKVWAMFQETDKKMQETARQIQETDRQMQETDKKMRESAQKSQEMEREMKESREDFDRRMKESREKFDRQMKESREDFDRQMRESREESERKSREMDRRMAEVHAETERVVKEFAKSVNEFKGDISNRLGEVAEHLVAPHIEEKFNELGFDFPESAVNVKVKDRQTRQTKLQIDILLENGSSVVAVEVKTKPTVADVKEFAERLTVFRQCRNERPQGEPRVIYGAMAGAVFQQHVKAAALKEGFFIITQSGDTMEIENPQGFQPKKF